LEPSIATGERLLHDQARRMISSLLQPFVVVFVVAQPPRAGRLVWAAERQLVFFRATPIITTLNRPSRSAFCM
jgi:hypothetical protein